MKKFANIVMIVQFFHNFCFFR